MRSYADATAVRLDTGALQAGKSSDSTDFLGVRLVHGGFNVHTMFVWNLLKIIL
jgi:hypothetical protein